MTAHITITLTEREALALFLMIPRVETWEPGKPIYPSRIDLAGHYTRRAFRSAAAKILAACPDAEEWSRLSNGEA